MEKRIPYNAMNPFFIGKIKNSLFIDFSFPPTKVDSYRDNGG